MTHLKRFTTLMALCIGVGIFLLTGCSAEKSETDSAEESTASVEATMVYYAMPG